MEFFRQKYPNISEWTENAVIEIGYCYNSNSFIRVIDEGGFVWVGKPDYPSIDEAFDDLEGALSELE